MPPSGKAPAYGPTSYSPPQYLLAITGLSHDELVSQYQAFCSSLLLVEAAPEFVFERLVGNLGHAFNTTVAQHRIQRVAQQSDRDPPTAVVERAESHPNALPSETRCMTPSRSAAPPQVSSETASATTPQEVYLQFWFEAPSMTSCSSIPSVRASTTATPVPYNLGSSSASLDQLYESKYYGAYDSRMDSTITGARLPAILSKTIEFNQPFPKGPEVVVWLTGLSSTTGAMVSVNATATKITTSQFTLQIDSSGGEDLISVGAGWAAWTGRETHRVEDCAGLGWMSSPATDMQLSAVSAVKLVLKQSVFLELVVTEDVLAGGAMVWHFRWNQGAATEISGRAVNVLRSNSLAS